MSAANIDFAHTETSFYIDCDDYQLVGPLSESLLQKAFALRGQVFCRELRWVGESTQLNETDIYDESVFHLGVRVKGGDLAGYLRIHPAGTRWMIDTVFPQTVPPGHTLHRPGTCEASRMAVSPEYRCRPFKDGQTTTGLLFQLLFAHCRLNNVETVCMIVSKRMARSMRLHGLPCQLYRQQNATPQQRDDPVFAMLSWKEFMLSESKLVERWRPSYLQTEANIRDVIRRQRAA